MLALALFLGLTIAVFAVDYAHSRRQATRLQDGYTPRGVDSRKVHTSTAIHTGYATTAAWTVGQGARANQRSGAL